MTKEELLSDKKEFNNSVDIMKDILQGDTEVLKRFDNMNLDMDAIKTALKFLTENVKDDKDRLNLFTESWRINYKSKPPTPEEFVTDKYLGPAAEHTYPWVKNTFIEFMNPSKPYRNLILYPHIGWGKDQPLDSKVYTSNKEYKLMKDINVGDKVLSPDGSLTEVVGTINWPVNTVYELEMDNGKTMKCGPHHLHYVSYRNDENDNKIWEIVETQFIIDNPDLEFEFKEVDVEK